MVQERNIQIFIINIIILIIVVLAIIFVFINIGIEKILTELAKFSIESILFVSIFFLSSYILRSYRFKKLLSDDGYLSILTVFPAVITAQTTNNFLPARIGDLFRIYFLHQKNPQLSYPKGIAALTTERIEDMAIILFYSLIGIILFGYSQEIFPFWFLFLIAILFLGVIIVFFGFLWKKGDLFQELFVNLALKLSPKNKTLAEITKRSIMEFNNQITHYLTDGVPILVETTFLTSIIWIIEALSCYLLFTFIGIKISIYLVLFAIAVANMSLALPTTPGGVGVYELILSLIFLSNGINEPVSLGLALLDHGLKILSVSILGLFFYLTLYFRFNRKEKSQIHNGESRQHAL